VVENGEQHRDPNQIIVSWHTHRAVACTKSYTRIEADDMVDVRPGSYRFERGVSLRWLPTIRTSQILVFAFVLLCLPCASTARRTRLTWVNGIGHHLQHMEDGEEKISSYFGGEPVLLCYNPTSQAHDEDMLGYVGDLAQAAAQLVGRITAEVDALAQHLREAIADVGPRGCVVIVAHSQGALITFLASKQLTPDEMSQIEVLAFGGAAALRKTSQTPFRRCVNYFSVNDPVLLVVPEAAKALRSGLCSEEEFCFLAPRAGDPIADHSLVGPTYAQALQWEGTLFQQKYRSIVSRNFQRFFGVRHADKRTQPVPVSYSM
jgi:hypothetical protein